MTQSIFDPQENPPLEVRLQEGKFTQGDRDFFTREMRELMYGTYADLYPTYQATSLRRTFDPARSKDIGQPIHWHLRVSVLLTELLQQQLQALDHWFNWLHRYEFRPYQTSWQQFLLEYWLSRERFPLPYGDAGFREIHRALRQNKERSHSAPRQLMYAFYSGRITLFGPNSSLGNMAASFRQPPLLHPVEPLTLYFTHEDSPDELLGTPIRLKRAVLTRPVTETFSFLPTAESGHWPAFLTFRT